MNVSEGRDLEAIAALVAVAGRDCLDVHVDAHHHRAVLTLVGTEAPRAVTARAVEALDLAIHDGAHPRHGVVDVVPFVALDGSTFADARAARDAYGRWLAEALGVPGLAYGPERTLPEARRAARQRPLEPTWGPTEPHRTAGITCVGARPVLVAYNVWLARPDVAEARRVAAAVRGPHLRSLGLAVGWRAQVSMNLIAPDLVGPADAFDAVAAQSNAGVLGAELVGLVPEAVLRAVDASRWDELDLSADRTIEARLAARART